MFALHQGTQVSRISRSMGPFWSQVKDDPGWIVITAVTGVLGAAIDPGFAQVVLQRRAKPDLVKQLVTRRSPRFLEAMCSRLRR
jgi:hypothetical protein